MINVNRNLILLITLATIVLLTPVATVFGKEIPLMTKEELKPIMNNADVVIMDVRSGRDWSSSEFKIQGAIRVDKQNMSEVAGSYPKDKKLVLYCA